MIISLPFLLITFIVYACLPKLRNLHGKCLMSYTFALMVLYVGLVWINSQNDSIESNSFECVFFGYQILFGIKLCFFWLNCMCYEIWSSFKTEMRTTYGDQRQFKKYCIYAFGVPVVFTLTVLLIDSTTFVPVEYRPEIGTNRCWVKESILVESIYVYIPMSLILTANIIIYSITAFKITKFQKQKRSKNQQKNQKMDADKDQFFIYLKLFLMSGASWIAESISFFMGQNYIFYVTDFLNCLQGVIIFILFVCKKNVRQMISEKWVWFDCFS